MDMLCRSDIVLSGIHNSADDCRNNFLLRRINTISDFWRQRRIHFDSSTLYAFYHSAFCSIDKQTRNTQNKNKKLIFNQFLQILLKGIGSCSRKNILIV